MLTNESRWPYKWVPQPPTPSSSTDCHDLYLAGHQESGVYSIVRGMEMQPVFCNMTAEGGWTVIQRRSDGTQDFDRGKTCGGESGVNQ